MKSKAFTLKSRKAAAGFSLIELLITLFITSVMLLATTGFFSATVATTHNMGLQTETQQGVRALLSIVTQELRQAGACLPATGQFIALDGFNAGSQDSLTLRIGQTNPNTLTCITTGTTQPANTGDTVLTVANGQGNQFAGVAYVYVTPPTAAGDFYRVASQSATTITLNTGISSFHAAGTGIFAVDERTYEIGTLNGRSVLTVSMDGGSAQPLVDGVEEFQVLYHSMPCTLITCDVSENVPVDSAAWRQVRQIEIHATVSSRQNKRDGQTTYESDETIIKPRNLL